MRDRDELPVHVKSVESLPLRPARHVGVKTFASFHQRREHLQGTAFRGRLNLFYNGSRTLFFHRQITVGTELRSGFCEQEAQEMVNLSDRRDGRFAPATSDTLLDGNSRRQSAYQIDIWFFELLHELPCVRRHAVEKAALSLGKKNIERDGRLAGAAQPGDHHKLSPRDFQIDVFEIVLARAMNMNRTVRFWTSERPERCRGSIRCLVEWLFSRAQR